MKVIKPACVARSTVSEILNVKFGCTGNIQTVLFRFLFPNKKMELNKKTQSGFRIWIQVSYLTARKEDLFFPTELSFFSPNS